MNSQVGENKLRMDEGTPLGAFKISAELEQGQCERLCRVLVPRSASRPHKKASGSITSLQVPSAMVSGKVIHHLTSRRGGTREVLRRIGDTSLMTTRKYMKSLGVEDLGKVHNQSVTKSVRKSGRTTSLTNIAK